MYTSALHDDPEKILTTAREDLIAFLDFTPEHMPIRDYFRRSRREFRPYEKDYQQYIEMSSFIKKYLDWLDGKYPKHQIDQHQREFMEMVEGWLLGLTRSKTENLPYVLRAPSLIEYGNFIVKRALGINYSLEFLTRRESRFDLKKLPSFLIMSSSRETATVVVDEEMIWCKDKQLCEKRYEMCLLHETAHARLHGPWLLKLQRETGEPQVDAMPAFEADAWLYAYTVLGCISGLRSRLTRFLREEDNEVIL
jgi:hypothetical protein